MVEWHKKISSSLSDSDFILHSNCQLLGNVAITGVSYVEPNHLVVITARLYNKLVYIPVGKDYYKSLLQVWEKDWKFNQQNWVRFECRELFGAKEGESVE